MHLLSYGSDQQYIKVTVYKNYEIISQTVQTTSTILGNILPKLPANSASFFFFGKLINILNQRKATKGRKPTRATEQRIQLEVREGVQTDTPNALASTQIHNKKLTRGQGRPSLFRMLHGFHCKFLFCSGNHEAFYHWV